VVARHRRIDEYQLVGRVGPYRDIGGRVADVFLALVEPVEHAQREPLEPELFHAST
jgi:hypothetical protein